MPPGSGQFGPRLATPKLMLMICRSRRLWGSLHLATDISSFVSGLFFADRAMSFLLMSSAGDLPFAFLCSAINVVLGHRQRR